MITCDTNSKEDKNEQGETDIVSLSTNQELNNLTLILVELEKVFVLIILIFFFFFGFWLNTDNKLKEIVL